MNKRDTARAMLRGAIRDVKAEIKRGASKTWIRAFSHEVNELKRAVKAGTSGARGARARRRSRRSSHNGGNGWNVK